MLGHGLEAGRCGVRQACSSLVTDRQRDGRPRIPAVDRRLQLLEVAANFRALELDVAELLASLAARSAQSAALCRRSVRRRSLQRSLLQRLRSLRNSSRRAVAIRTRRAAARADGRRHGVRSCRVDGADLSVGDVLAADPAGLAGVVVPAAQGVPVTRPSGRRRRGAAPSHSCCSPDAQRCGKVSAGEERVFRVVNKHRPARCDVRCGS